MSEDDRNRRGGPRLLPPPPQDLQDSTMRMPNAPVAQANASESAAPPSSRRAGDVTSAYASIPPPPPSLGRGFSIPPPPPEPKPWEYQRERITRFLDHLGDVA